MDALRTSVDALSKSIYDRRYICRLAVINKQSSFPAAKAYVEVTPDMDQGDLQRYLKFLQTHAETNRSKDDSSRKHGREEPQKGNGHEQRKQKKNKHGKQKKGSDSE
jgi:hypothetical protein